MLDKKRERLIKIRAWMKDRTFFSTGPEEMSWENAAIFLDEELKRRDRILTRKINLIRIQDSCIGVLRGRIKELNEEGKGKK